MKTPPPLKIRAREENCSLPRDLHSTKTRVKS
jgi:hypothetical protein